jgi:exonuclease III
LGASYCRQSHTHGGVGIFVHNTLSYSTINLNKVYNDYDLEACAIKLIISTNTYYILCIYRPPAGNFTTFLLHLESILSQLYSATTNLIICGDINVNYLQNSRNKSLLDCLLASFNLHSAINFPTRINNSSSTATDNIFIDKIKNTDYSVIPITNGLSDHDAQLKILHNTDIPIQ